MESATKVADFRFYRDSLPGPFETGRPMDLVIIALFASASATAVGLASPPDALRVPLMLPLALFVPGYSVISALYPRREDMDPLERLALSFVASLAALPLIALALNYSPWGVRWEPLLAFLSLLVVLASALGLLRRRLLPAQEERFAPALHLNLAGRVTTGAVLRNTARAALVVPLAGLAVILLTLLAGQRTNGAPHTEFYLLGAGGRLDSFPRTLQVGQDASLVVGVTNQEAGPKEYRVTVSIDGTLIQEVTGVRLDPGQRWQRPFILTPSRAGDRQLVQFELHMEGASSRAYRTLYLWVDVLQQPVPWPGDAFAQEQTAAFVEAAAPASAAESTIAPAPAATSTPPLPQPQVHRVAPGENLTHIARLYGVSLEAILAANPLPNPNLIYAQQEILIPTEGGE